MSNIDPQAAASIRREAEARAAEPGALLSRLHAMRDEPGLIPEDAVTIAPDALNLSRAGTHGAHIFYQHVYGRLTPERLEQMPSKP